MGVTAPVALGAPKLKPTGLPRDPEDGVEIPGVATPKEKEFALPPPKPNENAGFFSAGSGVPGV